MFWLIAAQVAFSPGMTRDEYLGQVERQYWSERGVVQTHATPNNPINNFNCTNSSGVQTCRNLSGQGFRCQNVNGQISCVPFGY